MTNTQYITPINVLDYLGISKERYAQMTQGEVMMLVRTAYALQSKQQSNNNK